MPAGPRVLATRPPPPPGGAGARSPHSGLTPRAGGSSMSVPGASLPFLMLPESLTPKARPLPPAICDPSATGTLFFKPGNFGEDHGPCSFTKTQGPREGPSTPGADARDPPWADGTCREVCSQRSGGVVEKASSCRGPCKEASAHGRPRDPQMEMANVAHVDRVWHHTPWSARGGRATGPLRPARQQQLWERRPHAVPCHEPSPCVRSLPETMCTHSLVRSGRPGPKQEASQRQSGAQIPPQPPPCWLLGDPPPEDRRWMTLPTAKGMPSRPQASCCLHFLPRNVN